MGLVTFLFVYLFGICGIEAAQTDGRRTVDFGAVGVDFLVFHSFTYVNQSSKPVVLKTKNVPCECSKVTFGDTLVSPGDSTSIRLEFDTKNVFGPTAKAFTISTTDPSFPELEYYYISNVGQWLLGVKPEPASAFFLPAHKTKTLTLSNPRAGKLGITFIDQADSIYSVSVKKQVVSKGEKTEIEVAVSPNLSKGTYYSSFRLRIDPSEGANPFLLTIPVKIVRY
ncbi:MAG: DUF1573 domain-containing protein [bacterium]|nr:DUF1573 domain-containing protein [bacterium]